MGREAEDVLALGMVGRESRSLFFTGKLRETLGLRVNILFIVEPWEGKGISSNQLYYLHRGTLA